MARKQNIIGGEFVGHWSGQEEGASKGGKIGVHQRRPTNNRLLVFDRLPWRRKLLVFPDGEVGYKDELERIRK